MLRTKNDRNINTSIQHTHTHTFAHTTPGAEMKIIRFATVCIDFTMHFQQVIIVTWSYVKLQSISICFDNKFDDYF